jgi:hypothetical protein
MLRWSDERASALPNVTRSLDTFDSQATLAAHPVWWMREEGDLSRARDDRRGTYTRLREKAAMALWPLKWRTRFHRFEDVFRRVHADACIEVETNRYCMQRQWLIGERARSHIWPTCRVHLLRTGQEVAVHPRLAGQRRASIHREYLLGIAGTEPRPTSSRLNTVCDAAERTHLPATGLAFIVRRVGRSDNRGATTVQELSRSRWRLRPGRPVPFQQMAKQQQ